jgi:cytochrome c biogenesis protein CcmG/thiol:disulfide interchange protein DsbE
VERHTAENLALVGVLFKDEPEPAREFENRMAATWPTVDDPNGDLATAYRVIAPPQTYFIDRDGIVRSMQIGQVIEADMAGHLARILP